MREATAHARQHATHFTIANYSNFTISSSVFAFVSPIPLPKFIPTDSGGRYERHDSHDSHIDSISHSIPCALHFFQSSGPSPESDRRRSSLLDSVLFVAVGGFGAIREKYWLASARKRLSDLDISVWPEANRACTSVGRPTQGIIDTR